MQILMLYSKLLRLLKCLINQFTRELIDYITETVNAANTYAERFLACAAKFEELLKKETAQRGFVGDETIPLVHCPILWAVTHWRSLHVRVILSPSRMHTTPSLLITLQSTTLLDFWVVLHLHMICTRMREGKR